MAINYAVYGEPETWQNSKIFDGSTISGLEILRASRPKVPNFDGNGTTASSQLRTAITTGVITQNEPIDKTITPCGQDPEVSPWGSVAIYYNQLGTTSSLQPIKISEIKRDTPINWCFFERSSGVYGDRAYSINRMEQNTFQNRVWSPDSVNSGGTSNENGTYYIAPFMEYQLKSILLSLQVQRITGYNASGVPSTSWIAADSWKNTYNTDKICGIRLVMRPVSGTGTGLTNIAYQTNFSPASYTGVGAMLLDSIDVGANEGGLTESFYQYGVMGGGTTATVLSYVSSLYRDSKCYAYIPCYNYFDDAEIKTLRLSSSPYGQVWQEIPYSENNYEKILKIAALFGCYFTPSSKTTFATAFTDSDLYLPIIDDNGIAHGEYTRGADNINNDLYNADSVRDKGYDPAQPVDPNTYSNVTGFNTISSNAALTYRYVLDAANVEKLGDDLYTICDSLSAQDFENFDGKIKDEFLTQSPIDAIISLQRFPFEIPHTGSSIGAVQLGKTEGQAQGYRTFFAFNTILFTGISIFPRFGNCFLDYEPYTSYELYIPFCGSTKIRAADILGHTLNIQMQIDLITGSCTAYIMADSLVIETASGSCGIEQPLSGIDSATINSNILQGLATQDALAQQKVNQFGAAVWPTGIIKDVLNPFGTKQAFDTIEAQETQNELSLTHIEAPPHKMGAASPLLAWYQEFNARLMIYYPEGDVIDSSIPPSLKQAEINSFGRLKGFATFTPGIVSSFSGFTRGDIRADGIPCTASERQRIKSMFSAGVYL